MPSASQGPLHVATYYNKLGCSCFPNLELGYNSSEHIFKAFRFLDPSYTGMASLNSTGIGFVSEFFCFLLYLEKRDARSLRPMGHNEYLK